jgi:hypothetical protein
MSDPTNRTVLDHQLRIVIPGDVFSNPSNEYWALTYLWHGMENLYLQVLVLENDIRTEGQTVSFEFGNTPTLLRFDRALITCFFHWYAISACQYVRTVGWIANRNGVTKTTPRQYLQEVIPEVHYFRDKFAAHLVGTSDDSRDDTAIRLASLLPNLGIHSGRFIVPAFGLSVSRGDDKSSTQFDPWSLTEVHERLSNRYHPKTLLPKTDS